MSQSEVPMLFRTHEVITLLTVSEKKTKQKYASEPDFNFPKA